MRIKIRPVRWWRDECTRYMTRAELGTINRRFNLSEVPRGDDPDLDAFVANWRDTIGFYNPGLHLPPMPHFKTAEPDPIADIAAGLRLDDAR